MLELIIDMIANSFLVLSVHYSFKPFGVVQKMSGNFPILLLICAATIQALPLDCFKSIRTGTMSVVVSKTYFGKFNRSLLNVELDDSSWILNQLMKNQQWSFQSFSDKSVQLGPNEQLQQPGHEAVFLFLETTDSLLHMLKIVKAQRILKPDSRIFLVTSSHQPLVYFQLIWKNLKAINSFIITDSNFYSFDPLNNNTIKSINCVENSSLQNSLHLQQYPVHAMIFPDHFPYGTNDGICARCLNVFKNAFNLQMNITFAKIEENPYAYVNGNEYGGLYAMLDQQQMDIVCGSQPIVIFVTRCCEVLPAFIRDEIVWVLPKAQKMEAWRSLVLGFEVSVWVCVIASWFFSSVVFWVKDHRVGFLEVTVNVFGCILGCTHLRRFRKFTWLFLLYAIVITTCYKSKLVGLMAIPQYEKQFKDLREAADAGLNALLYVAAIEPVKALYSASLFPSVRGLAQPGRYQVYAAIEAAVEQISQKRQDMALMSKHQADMVIQGKFLDSQGDPLVVYVSDTHVNLHMYASPANPLLHVFRKQVLYLNEAGLVNYWVEEMKTSAKLEFVYRNVTSDDSEGRSSGANLSGIFSLFMLGMLVSCCFFVLECLAKKIKKALVKKE